MKNLFNRLYDAYRLRIQTRKAKRIADAVFREHEQKLREMAQREAEIEAALEEARALHLTHGSEAALHRLRALLPPEPED